MHLIYNFKKINYLAKNSRKTAGTDSENAEIWKMLWNRPKNFEFDLKSLN